MGEIIYRDCSARVKVNGFTTTCFPIERGVRQSCPFSSILYVLCAEVLCLEVQNNKEIIGVKYGNRERKDLEYDDDMSIAITDINSINTICLHS